MSVEAIILIAIGFILLFVELFLIPGFGPIGVMGAVLMGIGVVIVGYREGLRAAVISAGVVGGVSIPVCALGIWWLPRTRVGKTLILDVQANKESGYTASEEKTNLIGKTGIAITKLRPAGIANIDGKRVDVVTEGEMIDAHRTVEVIGVDGIKIIVRELETRDE